MDLNINYCYYFINLNIYISYKNVILNDVGNSKWSNVLLLFRQKNIYDYDSIL